MEHTFLRELDAMHEVAVRYEDEETRAMAASLIPADTLRARVKAIDPSPEHAQDLLLIELLKWFKEEFFSWHDQPTCETCKTLTYHQGLVPPTVEEMRYLAQRVESYFCPGCKKSYRFPRYNCPRKLMETRSGRCGEWANVFTLCCLALGFDARYIYDVTDHVWTEVWSDFLRRWVHCDACEAEIDKPLLYELGWGKKLRYVIAFSAYETADVTWRYVWDFDKTLQVRKTIKESDLIQYQEERTRKYQEGMDAETKLKHARRRVRELTDFLTPSRIDAQGRSYGGRVSGNLEWRLARRETMTGDPITNKNPDIKELELTYICSKDEYTKRENGGDDCTKIGWAAYMTTIVDIHRKVEKDWKMTYLARTPGSDVGMFEYTFALTKPCRSLTIYFKTEVFHSGQAIINVIADGTTICVKNNELTAALDGAKEIRVACELSGGNGNTAWQHAQAFRQLVDDKTPMLRIILRF